jgi:mannosyltransferase
VRIATPFRDRRAALTLVAILAAGAFLRFYELSAPSLWLDEAFSWRMVQFSWAEIPGRTAIDVHPPLYYFVLKAWTAAFGDSVFAMRSLSGLLSLASLVVFYFFCVDVSEGSPGAERPDPTVGLLATALAALSVFQVVHAREARMYPLGALLAIASSWALWRALRGRGSPAAAASLYAALAAGLAYTHNYGLFTIAAQVAFAIGSLARDSRRDGTPLLWSARSRWVAAAILAAGMAYAPWVPILLGQRAHVVADYWIKPLSLDNVFGSIEQILTADDPGHPPAGGGLAAAAAAVVVGALLAGRRAGDAYVFTLAVTPFALGVGLSACQGRNILIGKYLYFSFLFLLLAAAMLVRRIPGRPGRAAVGLLLALNLAGQDALAWGGLGAVGKPGIRAAAAAVARGLRGGDLVLTLDPGGFLAARYYLRGRARPLCLLAGDSPRKHEGRAVRDGDDELSVRRLGAWPGGRAWVIATGVANYKLGLFSGRWKLVRSWTFEDCVPFRSSASAYLYEVAPGSGAAPSPGEDVGHET